MRIYDITRTVQEAPIYPGSPPVDIRRVSDVSEGGESTVSLITADSHMGTHADAFSHYLGDRGLTIDAMPLDHYCGTCRVLSVPMRRLITVEDIRGKIEGFKRIALHGGGESYLCRAAAGYLASCGVRLLVTDAVSIAPPDNEAEIHTLLFEAGIAVIENAVLEDIRDGDYLIFAFPIKYGGLDGAPVRAVLLNK